MPFGLTNAPAIFCTLMNKLFHSYFDKFVVIYLDDIVVYRNNMEDHVEHLCKVLKVLRDNKLYVKREKCSFAQPTVHFLGHTISHDEIRMDSNKIDAIKNWEAPTKVPELRSFLVLANYYRRFIFNYSAIATPLTDLLKKDPAFERLKTAVTEEPVLSLPDFSKAFEVHTDASDFAIVAESLNDFYGDATKGRDNRSKTIPPKVDNNNKGRSKLNPNRGSDTRNYAHDQPSNFRKNYEDRKRGAPQREGCYICGETTHDARYCPSLRKLSAMVAAEKQQEKATAQAGSSAGEQCGQSSGSDKGKNVVVGMFNHMALINHISIAALAPKPASVRPRESLDVMPTELPQRLPPLMDVDHQIELVPGAKPLSMTPYRTAPPELEELRKQLKELLDAGHIRPFKAPFGDEPKTACVTRYGAFDWLLMPFGLTSAPATFCTLMNKLFHSYMDQFIVIYLDDIVVYSNNKEDHVENLCKVFKVLRDNELYVKQEKCSFAQPTFHFLGHTISHGEIQMDSDK
uniref:Reverse transcriptase domain-containing protein n=1 Tax=Solanum lycopersicum TaxID=4081 RepID=A0A3Q7EW80_SOLLC